MKTLDVTISGSLHSVAVPDSLDLKALRRAYERAAKKGAGPAEVAAFKAMLNETPGLWRFAGDIQEVARQALARYASGSEPMRQAILHGLKETRETLNYAAAPPLERLLIEQIAMTAYHLAELQSRYYQVVNEPHEFTLGEYYEKRVTAAHSRHVRACEALARVRRLSSRRPLQINVAQQQVVVADESASSASI